MVGDRVRRLQGSHKWRHSLSRAQARIGDQDMPVRKENSRESILQAYPGVSIRNPGRRWRSIPFPEDRQLTPKLLQGEPLDYGGSHTPPHQGAGEVVRDKDLAVAHLRVGDFQQHVAFAIEFLDEI